MSPHRSDAPPTPSDRRDTDPDEAPATPRDTGITVTLPSDAPPGRTSVPERRASRRPRAAGEQGEDTLLSAPAPADALDVELDDRLRESERRIDELESRVRYLENVDRAAPAPAASNRDWLVWVVLLLVLAVSWMLFHR